jgi:hypothetical protein
MKRYLLAVVAVFLAWSALDVVIHGVILAPTYQATAQLWRPEAEMKMGLMYGVGLIAAAAFVAIYARLCANRTLVAGIWYGLLFGIGTGVSMGYGTYAVMPIPYSLALTWFLGTVVEAVTGGLLVGWIVRK